jgi:uncharacterized membrane protein
VTTVISLGRTLIILGIVLLLLGLILTYSHYFPFARLGRLPGDISIKKGNFSFYFPLTTCILFSVLLTLILYLLRK